MYKVDVEFAVGEVVEVGSVNSCRFERKRIAEIDEEKEILFFTDGSIYHHTDDPSKIVLGGRIKHYKAE